MSNFIFGDGGKTRIDCKGSNFREAVERSKAEINKAHGLREWQPILLTRSLGGVAEGRLADGTTFAIGQTKFLESTSKTKTFDQRQGTENARRRSDISETLSKYKDQKPKY